ncbi:MAG: hypothetical protein VB046_05090 [Paludibacter sp.]|nr:hypothetical protein [Paludibacter sp.]
MKTSPFKDKVLLESEVRSFINKYKAIVINHSSRISDYFEMSCFNMIVRFYENDGYNVTIENLKGKHYRYKCSTSGVQSNFSHFKISKSIEGALYEYEIHHNLNIESSHCKDIFTTPDISIIKLNTIKETTDYYVSKKRFTYVENEDMISFCEVKNFNPFPELVLNFTGIVNELRKKIINKEKIEFNTCHIAPSLMVSGKGNKQTNRIKNELEDRYNINVIYELFYLGTSIFSKANYLNLAYE